jgi:hypothetical protein
MALMLVLLALLAHPAPTPTPASALLAAATAARSTACDPTVQAHVYKPQRLTVYAKCVAVTGTIVDATHGTRTDGVRKEADGDTHGWLKLDPPFAAMVNRGNKSNEGGNLVYEVVCYWKPTQADAVASCPANYHNAVTLAPIGAHVEIVGVFVRIPDGCAAAPGAAPLRGSRRRTRHHHRPGQHDGLQPGVVLHRRHRRERLVADRQDPHHRPAVHARRRHRDDPQPAHQYAVGAPHGTTGRRGL